MVELSPVFFDISHERREDRSNIQVFPDLSNVCSIHRTIFRDPRSLQQHLLSTHASSSNTTSSQKIFFFERKKERRKENQLTVGLLLAGEGPPRLVSLMRILKNEFI